MYQVAIVILFLNVLKVILQFLLLQKSALFTIKVILIPFHHINF